MLFIGIVLDKDVKKLLYPTDLSVAIDLHLDCKGALITSKSVYQVILTLNNKLQTVYFIEMKEIFLMFLTFFTYIFWWYIISGIKFTCVRTFIITK